MNNRQRGKFQIAAEIIRDTPDIVAEAFQIMRLVPVRAEMLYTMQAIEYIALSELFPEVEENHVIPEYVVNITSENGHVVLVEYGLMTNLVKA